MTSKQLIKSLGACRVDTQLQDFQVKGISSNSKCIQDGFIFVAIKGTHEDGNKFIDEAVANGAKVVVADSSWSACPERSRGMARRPIKVPLILVDDTRRALAKLATEFYAHPSQKIKVIGVTGTNGKTTITYLIEAMLQEAGFQPAVIGTVNYRFGGKIISSKNTTPGALELQSMLADMLQAGCDYAVMEVSSHALDQQRTGGISFNSAIFTNLTQDHLDYHKTLEDYFQAKAKLFKDLSNRAYAVINSDDKYAKGILGLTRAKAITYGIDNPADVVSRDIKFSMCHTDFSVFGLEINFKIRSRLIGKHNVYNMLAAITWGLAQGIKPDIVKSALEKFSSVPGRLERIDSGNSCFVFVDYAHTDDALLNVITSLRQLSSRKIIVVFGCGGDRDKTKRPKMGRVVTELADYAIITNDNPRSEDPQAIIDDIKRGIKKENYCIMPDRAAAIKKSLEIAGQGDIVLIAGKGHENYQIIGNRREHFDDREVVEGCLKSQN